MPAERASVAAAPPPETIPQTSVDRYEPSAATVRFRRWAMHGNTAYLRGQEAGFSLAEAEMLQRRGLGDIIHRPRVADALVTK